MARTYEEYIHQIVTRQLEEEQGRDTRLNTLFRQYKSAKKKGDVKKAARLIDEAEKRRYELADELTKRQLEKDNNERNFAKFMSEKNAEEYMHYRDAIVLTLDVLETLFNDCKTLVNESLQFVFLEYPKEYRDAAGVIRRSLKEERRYMGTRCETVEAEMADKLAEFVMKKAREYKNRIEKL